MDEQQLPIFVQDDIVVFCGWTRKKKKRKKYALRACEKIQKKEFHWANGSTVAVFKNFPWRTCASLRNAAVTGVCPWKSTFLTLKCNAVIPVKLAVTCNSVVYEKTMCILTSAWQHHSLLLWGHSCNWSTTTPYETYEHIAEMQELVHMHT